MSDTLVERVTGQSFAAAVPLEIGLVMTENALLGRTETPAQLPGYGPIPAPSLASWPAPPQPRARPTAARTRM